jgi:hypothetical protein
LHNRPNEWSIFKKASPRKRIRCVGEDKREWVEIEILGQSWWDSYKDFDELKEVLDRIIQLVGFLQGFRRIEGKQCNHRFNLIRQPM